MCPLTMSRLYILNGIEAGRPFELKEGPNYIGRSVDNDIQIEDETVSRKQLRIIKKGNKYYITDLESQNGTFYNGNYLAPGIDIEIREGLPIAIDWYEHCLFGRRLQRADGAFSGFNRSYQRHR
jgi:pSer/pThr/pTyr-binding forkhead associated (FHA) protein